MKELYYSKKRKTVYVFGLISCEKCEKKIGNYKPVILNEYYTNKNGFYELLCVNCYKKSYKKGYINCMTLCLTTNNLEKDFVPMIISSPRLVNGKMDVWEAATPKNCEGMIIKDHSKQSKNMFFGNGLKTITTKDNDSIVTNPKKYLESFKTIKSLEVIE